MNQDEPASADAPAATDPNAKLKAELAKAHPAVHIAFLRDLIIKKYAPNPHQQIMHLYNAGFRKLALNPQRKLPASFFLVESQPSPRPKTNARHFRIPTDTDIKPGLNTVTVTNQDNQQMENRDALS